MKTLVNFDFDITSESLQKNKMIADTMDGKTFHFHTHILYDIRTKLGDGDITYLEIGSYCGASVSLLASHEYPTKCFSLDIGVPIDPSVVIKNVEKFKNKNSKFEYIKGSSYDKKVVETVYSKVDKIDLLFIDGDHSDTAVYEDFNNYSKLVSKNGYICFDDYLDAQYSPKVKIAVDNIIKSLDTTEYEVIGTLEYDQLKSYTNFPANSIFIIKKIK